MKPATRVMDVTSTLEGEKIGMTIDTNALAHIMSVLTDLYSDPEMAVIREYSTNAFDAHVEAGIDRPIEVQTPSTLSPFVKIRDYGEGLDAEDIREIYSKYGASTKRNSNDVVGMLGLGCKSALTYTDQFTLTGIKDGWMTQIAISREEDGTGSMTPVYEGETDDEQGVEIMIPVNRGNDFEEKAENFFRFWPEGSVLLNGEPPKPIDGIWIADDLLLTQEVDENLVVMGNVPYPFLESHDIPELGKKRYDYNTGRYVGGAFLVAFVNIGDVHFTPSRETLKTTSVTKATLANLRDRLRNEKNPAFERLIADAASKQEALKAFYDLVEIGYDGNMPVWNGYEVPREWTADRTEYPDGWQTCSGRKIHRRRDSGFIRNVENKPHRYGFIVNFEGAEMTAYKRAKLDQYITTKKGESYAVPETWVLIDKLPEFVHPDGYKETPAEWFPKDRILDWNVVNQEKITREKVQRRDGRPSGSYAGFIAGNADKQILAGNIDTNKPIFYEHGSSGGWYGPDKSNAARVIYQIHPDATFIVLGGNRLEKFRRDFPMAKEARTYLREEAQKWEKKLSENDKLVLHFYLDHDGNRNILRSLKNIKDSLLDPELRKVIDAAVVNNANLVNEWERWRQWGASYKSSFKNPLDRYALLTHVSSYATLTGKSQDHLYIYLNAAYEAEAQVAEKEAA